MRGRTKDVTELKLNLCKRGGFSPPKIGFQMVLSEWRASLVALYKSGTDVIHCRNSRCSPKHTPMTHFEYRAGHGNH